MRAVPGGRGRWPDALLAGWCLALAVLALGPALRPGYVLSYDMVAVPSLDLTREALGLGSAPPRAVPVDALTALLDQAVPGQVLQKIVLLGTLVAAGYGAARLTPSRSRAVRAVAATAYVWNPYVAERLVLGHWALLVAYAVLPWLARASCDLRAGVAGSGPRVVLLLALAAITPTGGLLAALVALAVLAWPGGRRRGRRVALAAASVAAVNAPWGLPAVLQGGGAATAAGGEAFAARGESLLGPLGALAGLGGVWNAQVVPGSRETVLAVLGTVLLLGLAAVGAGPLRRAADRGMLAGLAVAAGVGLMVAAAGVVPGVREGLGWLLERVPAAGLLRDGQKWIAPYALLLAPAAALGAERLAAGARDRATRRLGVAAAVLALLAVLPDLGWGVAGRLGAVHYPADWQRARSVLAADRGHGDVLVLPWGTFRAFAWNGRRTVLDPAPRYFPGSVVADADLPVGSVVVPGDDARAVRARAALGSAHPDAALGRLGVGWVLVEKGQPGEAVPVPAGRVAYDGPQLRLLRLPAAADRALPGYAAPVVAVDLLALGVVATAGLGAIARKSRRVRLPTGRLRPSRQR